MFEVNDMQAGKAGEYLVCADLILNGYVAYLSEQALSYDIVLDYSGRLIRVQVKTTRGHKAIPQRKEYTPAYLFNVRKMGKAGRRSYTANDVELFALVALDTRTIGYVPESAAKQTMIFRMREHAGEYYDERSMQRKQEITELRNQGLTFTEIGTKLRLDRSYVHRVFTGSMDYKAGTYLDELTIEKALQDI